MNKLYQSTVSWFSILRFFLFILLLACFVCSCRMGIRTKAMMGMKVKVHVNISEQANSNSPVAVDILYVYDKALMTKLLGMPSREWFEGKDQIVKDHAQGGYLDYWNSEWIPGQKIPVIKLPIRAAAEGGIIYAGYHTPGAHRIRFDPFKDIQIDLLEKDFTLAQMD